MSGSTNGVSSRVTVRLASAGPRVSVVMPCRDEEHHVRRALDSLLGGTWSDLEILVVDGASADRTREVVRRVAAQDARVRLLDNPRRATPAALNIGIRAARGSIIVRADAHSDYPPDYVATLVRVLEETGADLVGGLTDHVPVGDGAVERAIAIATGSAFGSASPMRWRRVSGPVDTVPFGCWRRAVFDRVGLFDERLLRNQDNEHASRILRAGGRIHQTARVAVRYHGRTSLRGLWRQAAATAMWNAFTHRLHPHAFRWRHLLPGLFFLGVTIALALVVAGALTDARVAALGAALVAPYLVANLAASTHLALTRRRAHLMPLIAFTLASWHYVYGFGITRGWLLVASGLWRDQLGAEARS